MTTTNCGLCGLPAMVNRAGIQCPCTTSRSAAENRHGKSAARTLREIREQQDEFAERFEKDREIAQVAS